MVHLVDKTVGKSIMFRTQTPFSSSTCGSRGAEMVPWRPIFGGECQFERTKNGACFYTKSKNFRLASLAGQSLDNIWQLRRVPPAYQRESETTVRIIPPFRQTSGYKGSQLGRQPRLMCGLISLIEKLPEHALLT